MRKGAFGSSARLAIDTIDKHGRQVAQLRPCSNMREVWEK